MIITKFLRRIVPGSLAILVLQANFNSFAAPNVTQESAQVTTQAEQDKSGAQAYKSLLNELLKARDPFKRISVKTGKVQLQSPLEGYTVDEFKMIGVITGLDRRRAMLVDPKGITYLVGEKMRIGTRAGTIKKISADGIIVIEKMKNLLGEDEWIESIIELRADPKGQLGAIAGSQSGPPSGSLSGPPSGSLSGPLPMPQSGNMQNTSSNGGLPPPPSISNILPPPISEAKPPTQPVTMPAANGSQDSPTLFSQPASAPTGGPQ